MTSMSNRTIIRTRFITAALVVIIATIVGWLPETSRGVVVVVEALVVFAPRHGGLHRRQRRPCGLELHGCRGDHNVVPPAAGGGGDVPTTPDDAVLPSSVTRRAALLGGTALWWSSCSSLPAVAADGAAESVRKLAANIPGYGPPDVQYPAAFAGRWRMTRTVLVATDDDDAVVTLEYPVRWLSRPEDVVVADRSYNERSYWDAAGKKKKVRVVDWDVTNPNVLTLGFADGSTQEIKVTKRSFARDKDTGGFFSSEYRRVTDVSSSENNPVGGIPLVTGSRVLTKWRPRSDDNDVIEGLELLYADDTRGDPMAAASTKGQRPPTLVMKSRLTMERLRDV